MMQTYTMTHPVVHHAPDALLGFTMVSRHIWVHSNHNGHNTAVIVGSQAVMVVDTRATPGISPEVFASIRRVTPLPIRYMALTHYRSVREFTSSANPEQVAHATLCRAQVDPAAEMHAVYDAGTVSLAPHSQFELGNLEVHILQLSKGMSLGETVVWVPVEQTVVHGNVNHFEEATANTFRASVQAQQPLAMDAIAKLKPRMLVPARGSVAPATTA